MGVFALLVIIQGVYFTKISEGVWKFSDPFSEANALRAAQAYLDDGISSFHGLPRQTYGTRFINEGFLEVIGQKNGVVQPVPEGMRRNLPARCVDHNLWLYTHYPEGPDILLTLIGYFTGLEKVHRLRLFPLGLGLLAAAVFFATLARIFGANRALVIAVGCVALPMFRSHMPGLHYQGYSLALLLLQISLLLHMYWRETAIPKWHWIALFFFGFLQGWLSFDQFFVVVLIAWPLWLLRKSEQGSPSKFSLAIGILLPIAGFGLAHFLHFLQVAGELGSIHAGIAEFGSTALERAGASTPPKEDFLIPKLSAFHALWYAITHPAKYLLNTVESSYLRNLIHASNRYLEDFFRLKSRLTAPALSIALILLLPSLLFHKIQLVFFYHTKSASLAPVIFSFGRALGGSLVPVLGAALFVSLIWLFVMAGHAAGNAHITTRHIFVFYLFVLIALSKGIEIRRGRAENGKTSSHE